MGVGESVKYGVSVTVGVFDGRGVMVLASVLVRVGVGVRVTVGVDVDVGVRVIVAVSVGVDGVLPRQPVTAVKITLKTRKNTIWLTFKAYLDFRDFIGTGGIFNLEDAFVRK